MDCSTQSANKGHTINVKENGEKVKKFKRFLTRSIREMYTLFAKDNSEVKIGRTKFYSLRPSWVIPHPDKNTCLCIYCTNFDLIVALKNFKNNKSVTVENLRTTLLSSVVCSREKLECAFQECEKCRDGDGIQLDTLGISDFDQFDDIKFAYWEKGELLNSVTTVDNFLKSF